MKSSYLFLLFFPLALLACRTPLPTTWQPPSAQQLAAAADLADSLTLLLGDLFSPLPSPPPFGSWQQAHPHEAAQPFGLYAKNNFPFSAEKKYIFIQQLGTFAHEDSLLLHHCKVALATTFKRKVILLEPDTTAPPAEAQRKNKYGGQPQWKSSYLLYNKLLKRRPDSTFAYLGFTGIDLYPSEKWNYVFGQASIRERTGVWSFHRFHRGTIAQGKDLAFFRAIKTSIHETGHILGIRHCKAWNCVMSGSNNLKDLDARPVHFCPQCVAKLCRTTGQRPAAYFQEMASFWQKQHYAQQAEHYTKAMGRWKKVRN